MNMNKLMGKKLEDHKRELDLEAWPNFTVFHANLKNHPALEPGSVELRSTTVPPAAGEVVVADEDDLVSFSPEGSRRCQSRTCKHYRRGQWGGV